jgi:tetratricopeptide (TPR) repeat protein
MAFKGSRRPLAEIARALGVDAVVQGSVQRSGDRVRVRVRLIDGRTDTHLWAHDYDSESKDVLRLEAVLAQAVGEELRVQITADERARMSSPADVDPAAHQEYLVGRYYLWRDTDEALQRAIGHFERATAIDPQYAAAYASLAHARWKQGLWGHDLSGAESPARAAAQMALQLDGTLAEAYVVQADLERLYARNMVRAEELVTRALMFDANSVDAHYTYALVLMTLGRFEEAVQQMESAERLDPLSPAVQSDFGRVLYRARRYDEAIVRLNRALDLEPAMGWLVHFRLAEVYEQMGQYDRAVTALRQADNKGQSYQMQHARVLARMGHHREAKALLKDIEADPSRLSRNAIAIAGVYAALGDNDKAFALLFDEMERGVPGPNFVAVDPPLETLRPDPRWKELVRRVNRPRETAHALQ